MKSLCRLTTTQHRLQRKILRKAKITFGSESSERKEQPIVQDNIVVEDRHLFFPYESSATRQSYVSRLQVSNRQTQETIHSG